MSPDTKNFGDLETNIQFWLSALSGKELAISKGISRTLISLEITLETGDLVGGLYMAARNSPVWGIARKEYLPAAPRPGRASGLDALRPPGERQSIGDHERAIISNSFSK